jgi:hypothetical protein
MLRMAPRATAWAKHAHHSWPAAAAAATAATAATARAAAATTRAAAAAAIATAAATAAAIAAASISAAATATAASATANATTTATTESHKRRGCLCIGRTCSLARLLGRPLRRTRRRLALCALWRAGIDSIIRFEELPKRRWRSLANRRAITKMALKNLAQDRQSSDERRSEAPSADIRRLNREHCREQPQATLRLAQPRLQPRQLQLQLARRDIRQRNLQQRLAHLAIMHSSCGTRHTRRAAAEPIDAPPRAAEAKQQECRDWAGQARNARNERAARLDRRLEGGGAPRRIATRPIINTGRTADGHIAHGKPIPLCHSHKRGRKGSIHAQRHTPRPPHKALSWIPSENMPHLAKRAARRHLAASTIILRLAEKERECRSCLFRLPVDRDIINDRGDPDRGEAAPALEHRRENADSKAERAEAIALARAKHRENDALATICHSTEELRTASIQR